MRGLRTARAVVIDDQPAEGTPLFEALSASGIGSYYYNGAVTQLPPVPLRGVRLIVTDLNLGDTGALEASAILAPLMNVLSSVVADDNGPFIIVVWTSHPELVTEFQGMLAESRPTLRPYRVVQLNKGDYRLEAAGEIKFDIDALAQKLRDEIQNWFPVDVLMDWEQRVHDAATDTTSALAELVAEDPDAEQGLAAVLAALAHADAARPLQTGHDVVRALHGGLNPLHGDCLETSLEELDSVEAAAAPLLEKGKLDKEKCAALNRRLFFAPALLDSPQPWPGNIYLSGEWKNKQFPIGENGVVGTREFITNLLQLPDDPDAREAQLAREWSVALVEVTPSCDHAQGKAPVARLVGSLFIPVDWLTGTGKLRISPSPSVRILEACALKRSETLPLEGEYSLIMSSRFVFGLALSKLKRHQESLRLRQEVLTDVQSWLAAQGARPGYRNVS